MIGRGFVALVGLGAILLAGAAPAAAQQGMRRGAPRAEMEQRIRDQFARVVQVQLGLDAQQQQRLGETVARFHDRRQALAEREADLRQRIGGLPLARRERAPLLTDAEAMRILGEMEALRDEEARLLRAEQEALLEVLSPAQLVRFYGMREQFAERIRRLQQGMGPPGGR